MKIQNVVAENSNSMSIDAFHVDKIDDNNLIDSMNQLSLEEIDLELKKIIRWMIVSGNIKNKISVSNIKNKTKLDSFLEPISKDIFFLLIEKEIDISLPIDIEFKTYWKLLNYIYEWKKNDESWDDKKMKKMKKKYRK